GRGTIRKGGSHDSLCKHQPRPDMISPEGWRADGELAAEISNTVVQALARTTGRGPTKAKTTIGDNGVFVVLQDSLTRGEQTLADAGEGEAVLDLRGRSRSAQTLATSHERWSQPRDRGAHRTQGDRVHERQPHRSRPRGRGF